MSVPKFKKFITPVLQSLEDGTDKHVREIREIVARRMELTEGDLQEKVAGGSQTKFSNRVNWSLHELMRAALVMRARRGVYELTDKGNRLLSKNPANLEQRVKWHIDQAYGENGAKSDSESDKSDSDITPEEALEAAYREVTNALEAEVLNRVFKVPSSHLEKTVIDLLVAMGYGGGDVTMSQVTGKAGDEGIDGTIKEDALGLDVIYVQAKRYSPTNKIGPAQVREFIGSLVGRGAHKGVYVTTSEFTDAAKQAANTGSGYSNIVLIDGKELARLMVRHDIGVRVRDPLRQPMQIKIVDENFFEEE